MTKRLIVLILGAAVILLLMTSVALASAQNPATPQDIYDDYAGIYQTRVNPANSTGRRPLIRTRSCRPTWTTPPSICTVTRLSLIH